MNTTTKDLLDWTDEDIAAWSPTQSGSAHRANHRLAETGLFEDEALIALLDTIPRESVHPYTMGSDPVATSQWQRGKISTLPGAELLETVRRGQLWLNVVRVHENDPKMHDLLTSLYEQIAQRAPGFDITDVSATLLISSPTAQVYYHADNQPNALWHVRGSKRVYVYPGGEPFLSTQHLEQIVSGNSDEQLPYRKDFDDAATVLELGAGQVGWWPQNRPHRVENVSGLNVSLSTEYRTVESTRREHVWTANHYGRSLTRRQSWSTTESGLAPAAKVSLMRSSRKLIGRRSAGAGPAATFEIDPSDPQGVRSLI
ncbi:hypothetical protein V3G39_03785 [Dermatophilaceae bacterium Sec6.4]|nr:hypothetical protein [Actinomycetota bacterium]